MHACTHTQVCTLALSYAHSHPPHPHTRHECTCTPTLLFPPLCQSHPQPCPSHPHPTHACIHCTHTHAHLSGCTHAQLYAYAPLPAHTLTCPADAFAMNSHPILPTPFPIPWPSSTCKHT